MNQPNNLPAAVAGSPPCEERRRINALVARAIGLRTCSCDHSKTKSPCFSGFTGHCLTCDAGACPDFSGDPHSSKQLRNKMRTDGWKSCLFTMDVFTMRYWGYKRGQGAAEAHADTEEMAVALAALRALGASLQAMPDGGAPQAEKK